MGRKKTDEKTNPTTAGGSRAIPPRYSRRDYLAVVSVVTFLSTLAIYRSLRPSSSSPSSSSSSSSSIAKTRNDAELLPTYDLPLDILSGKRHHHHHHPPHLTPIDPSTLVPRNSVPIDAAHREGMLHVGHVLFVLDASHHVLFLRRSDDVVTCPGTWSVLGEHATHLETPRDAVVRGIEEELGFEAVGRRQFDDDDDDDDGGEESDAGTPGSFVVRFRSRDVGKDESGGPTTTTTTTGGTTGGGKPPPLAVSIRNATERPLYYVRHYGPRNANRVDRQLTYLWYAIFPDNRDEIDWRLDDEVSDFRWVSLADARAWLSDDARAGDQAGGGGGEARLRSNDVVGGDATRATNDGDRDGGAGTGGGDDDGPDAGDFCHGTIRSLYEVGLEDILRHDNNVN